MRRNQVVKQIALISKAIGFFPVMIIASYGYSRTYPMQLFWLQLLLLIATGYLGYLQMAIKVKLQGKYEKVPVIGSLLLLGTYLVMLHLIVKISYLAKPADPIMRLIFLIMSIAAFLICMRDCKVHYSMVLSIERITAITFIYAIAMYLCRAQRMGILYLLIVAVYIFIGNQLKIEELLERTKKNTPLFDEIRKRNGRWVCLVMSLILIIYPLRYTLLNAIRWLGLKVLKFTLSIMAFIINLIPVTEGSSEQMGQASGMGNLPVPEKNELMELILWIIVIVSMVFLFYKYRRAIINGIKERLQKIGAAIRKIYSFLFGRVNTGQQELDYYEDHVEELTANQVAGLYKREDINKRQWRKEVRRYLRESIKQGSLREGYKLVLQGVKLKEVQIKSADTPREIRQQVESKFSHLSLMNQTKAYEEIRYGENQQTEEDVNQIKEVLKQLLAISK